MSDLTAIDILINPDDATIERARDGQRADARERARTGSPSTPPTSRTSRRCSATCAPPTSTRSTTPSRRPIADTDVAALSYQAVAIRHADWGVPGQGLAVLVVQPSPEVLDFQADLLAAVTPFTGSGGTARAFVTRPRRGDQPEHPRLGRGFVPDQIGPDKYIAHITVGFATLDDLKTIEAEPFDAFAVHPASVAVYHLGNNGTARTQLKAWTLRP